MTFPLCPPGGGKGPVMGALPPFEAPFQTPESPPLPRAEHFCSLPACSNQSFAFGTGGRKHPSPYAGRHEVRTRELPFRAYPVPPPEGLPGCGHDLRSPEPPAGPYGGKGGRHDVGLGRAPPCDPVPTSPSVPKAKLLLEHEDAGRTGRRSTLKGEGGFRGRLQGGASGGGNRRFPTTGPSLAPPGGRRG